MYRVEFTSAAARQVRKLDRPVRARLLDAIETLAHSPRSQKLKLQADRVGARHYRIVVTVVRVAHRREVYRS